jgi:hypothetical protein
VYADANNNAPITQPLPHRIRWRGEDLSDYLYAANSPSISLYRVQRESGVICVADDSGDIWQSFGLLGWASQHQH